MSLKHELNQFTGTEQYYHHPIGNLTYTDGVRYLCENGQCWWLLDAIGSYQHDKRITQDEMLQQMQFWKLKVSANKTAILICERDSDDVAITQNIEYTDFPLDEITLYVGSDRVVYLPSEH